MITTVKNTVRFSERKNICVKRCTNTTGSHTAAHNATDLSPQKDHLTQRWLGECTELNRVDYDVTGFGLRSACKKTLNAF